MSTSPTPPSPQRTSPSESRLAEWTGLSQPLHTMIYPQTHAALASKLKWVLTIRVVTATLLLGSSIGLQVRAGGMTPTVTALDGIIIAMYAFGVLCGFLLYRVRRLMAFALFQFVVDSFFVTALIYVTGTAESVFSFLYFFNIIVAAYVLFSPGAFLTATLSSLTYTAVLIGPRLGWAPHFRTPDPVGLYGGYFYYNLTVNVLAFYLVAFLSSYLAGQLRRAGDALRQEQGQFREMQALKNRIVENIGSGVITVSSDGLITSSNHAASAITGVPSLELLSRPLQEVIPQATAALHWDSDPRAIALGNWECTFLRGDDQTLILGFKVSPLRKDDGEEIGKILIVDDLTHIRAMEDRMRRDERLAAVGRLAAGIAHEIRNPLASISGSIQILQALMQTEGEDRTLMDIVVRETDRLNDLLTNFLQYVRQAPIHRTPIDLGSLIEETLSAVRRDPKVAPTVRFSLAIHHTGPVSGEPNQLRQVVWNLVLNAVEVIAADGHIQIRTRDVPPSATSLGPQIELIIEDDGPGIPPQVAPRIFDPFFSTKATGTGLGLAIVEKIIQTHDGSIAARGASGGGAEFVILLPAQSAPSAGLWTDGGVGGPTVEEV